MWLKKTSPNIIKCWKRLSSSNLHLNLSNRIKLLFILLLLSSSVYAIEWQENSYRGIVVYSAPKDTAYAGIMISGLQNKIDTFQMKLGVYPNKQLIIRILPNREEYKKLTSGKGKIVESSEAFYSPKEQVIYVRSPDQIPAQRYDAVLMHEYIHWFLDEVLHNAPLWFHEGMAYYYSGQYGFQSYYEFTRYLFMGYRLSLTDMNYNYPSDRSYWNMFYLTSAFAVKHMETRYNEQWQRFWDYVNYIHSASVSEKNNRTDFYQAFYLAFKKSIFAFSRDYNKVLKRYAWQFPLVGINAIIFAVLPFIVLASWLKQRRKLKAMPEPDSEIEEPDETDLDATNTSS